jgi:hypothetical protein
MFPGRWHLLADSQMARGKPVVLVTQVRPPQISASRLTQINNICPAVPPLRGAFRDRHKSGVGCGGRGSTLTNDAAADGEVVWF